MSMVDAQKLIREAQERAERLCELAVASTPTQYRSFIVLIEQRKKVGGSRQNPIYATIHLPYMSVDGLVKIARDQHEAAGKKLDVHTSFVLEPTTQLPVCRATVVSEIHGTVEATARIFLNGEGANETNPLETAETSAVGRALGMLGVGRFGTGIASADEVLRVVDRSSGPPATQSAAPGSPAGATTDARAPLPAPRVIHETADIDGELSALGRALGMTAGELSLLRAEHGDDGAALAALRARKSQRAGPAALSAGPSVPEDLTAATTRREDLLVHAAHLGVVAHAYRTYLARCFCLAGAAEPEVALTDAQLGIERGRFIKRYENDELRAKFREQCEKLAHHAGAGGTS
jgi:hypothetical protein